MGDTLSVAHLRIGTSTPFTQPPDFMRTATIAILGTPFACWALYGCLEILGVGPTTAIVVSIAWGVLWLCVAHLGRHSRMLRRDRARHGRGTPGGRGAWTGAVLGSYFLPLPVCLGALLVDWLHVASASLVLPLFAILALPAPAALWWMLLWPSSLPDEEMMRPIGWRRYTPHAPTGVIPPRGGPIMRD